VGKEKLIRSLRQKGFDEMIISAFENVPREDFVPKHWRDNAYKDTALDIGEDQTISQPYTIAFMLSLLELDKEHKILEVGSGSGYALALLDTLAPGSEVCGVERLKPLVERSKSVLKERKNISVFKKDGTKGLKKFAPYDRILVSASAKEIPEVLLDQLADGGILVTPVVDAIFQIKKTPTGLIKRVFPGFAFVPLVGKE